MTLFPVPYAEENEQNLSSENLSSENLDVGTEFSQIIITLYTISYWREKWNKLALSQPQ